MGKTKLVISKEKVFQGIEYEPHEGQAKIHKHHGRHRVAACGRRFGKSVVGGHELTPEALLTYHRRFLLADHGQRREFWIIGPEYSDSEKEFRVLWNDLQRLHVPFDRPGTYNNPQSGDMTISLWNGLFQVAAKSAKYPQTLVGEGLSGVVLAEAAKLKESVWSKYVRPTLADFRGWSLWLSTPEGKNFFYRAWQRGQDPEQPQWGSWRMPSWVNHIVFPNGASPEGIMLLQTALREGTFKHSLLAQIGVDEEIADMAVEMSEEKFNQEVAADFTEFVGRVFKDFDEETHVRSLQYDPSLPLYGACDYGWTNPFVWLAIQVDIWGTVYVLGEYRVTRKDINDIGIDLKAWPLAANSQTFFPDPASPGDSIVLEKILQSKGSGGTGGELKWRLELIRQHLRIRHEHLEIGHPDRQPRLLIDRSCTGLIHEMNEYRYPDSKSEVRANPEEPMDKDDHGPEALGRFMRGYFGGPGGPTAKGRARVTRANIHG